MFLCLEHLTLVVSCRYSSTGRPPHEDETLSSAGRARSLPTLAKARPTSQLARFASKQVHHAYVPKRARSRATGPASSVQLTTQDSLAAEALLSLCPSGAREMVSDAGVVESAPASSADAALQRGGSGQIGSPVVSGAQEVCIAAQHSHSSSQRFTALPQ